MAELLQLKLEDASLDEIAELALNAIGQNASAKKNINFVFKNWTYEKSFWTYENILSYERTNKFLAVRKSF